MKRWVKWTALLVGLIIGFIFSIKSTPIGDRAIVVGMAIDKADDLYEVSAQIITPTGKNSSSNGSAVCSVKNATISGAFHEIRKETSMQVALSHCNIVILGEGVIKDSAYNSLDYLVRNAYLSENALLTTAKYGRDILEAKVAYSEVASFYAQRIITTYGNFLEITKRNIKEYVLSYHTHNGANWLTKLEKQSTQKPDIEGEAAATDEVHYVFKMGETAIISKNKFVKNIDEKMTAGLNYATANVEKGSIHIAGDNGESIELYLLDKKNSTKYDASGMSANMTINVTILIKEIIPKDGNFNLTKRVLSQTEEQRVKDTIIDSVISLYKSAQSSGVDIYDMYGGMFRTSPQAWRSKYGLLGEKYLENVKLTVECKVKYE